jgi:hypothetical protein
MKSVFRCAFVGVVAFLPFFPALAEPDSAYAPLWLYKGSWEVKAVGAKADKLTNDCNLIGKYFGCQQTVNGRLSALIIFIPADKPGHYYTQAVLPEGWAVGRGELEIEGDHWTYHSKETENGKTTYYRTTNLFSGKDNIHFELSESSDGEHWKVTKSGDEVRTAN